MEFTLNKKIEGKFRIADYNLSHSELLLRSAIHDHTNINKDTNKYFVTTVEIKFSGMKYVELSTYLSDIEFLSPTNEDYEYVKSKHFDEIFLPLQKIYKILSEGKTYYVLAMGCDITHKYE